MPRIVVTPRSASRDGHPSLDALRRAGYEIVFPSPGRQPTEDELIDSMEGCVGYLAGVEPITRRVIEAATMLQVISRNGVGIDNIDADAAAERGITIARAVGSNARGVAELTIAHMLAAARDVSRSDGALKRGEWKRKKGIELCGRTLGLVGCGSVGQLVAEIALGLGMKVNAYDPYPPASFDPGPGFALTGMDAIIEESDVISLHCPPSPDGFVIGADEISRIKDGAILINTARASLVDTQAVLSALASGKLRGATVDAYDQEPPSDYSFVSSPHVVATPHIGGYTDESVDRALTMAVANLLSELGSREKP